MNKLNFTRACALTSAFLVTSAAQAGRWEETLLFPPTPRGGTEINAGNITVDTMILVDATLGFAGVRLPACTAGMERYIGVSKRDDTANPVHIRTAAGVTIGGYTDLALVERDDVIVMGCVFERWFIESRSELVRRSWAVNRTVVASTPGQNPYQILAEHERDGVVRMYANTTTSVAILPVMDHCVQYPGYGCTVDVTVFRTENSVHQVHVYAPPGRSISGIVGPAKLCLPNQSITFHYDGNQFHVHNRFPETACQ